MPTWLTKLTTHPWKRFKQPNAHLCGREAMNLCNEVPGRIAVFVVYPTFSEFKFKQFFCAEKTFLDAELTGHPLFLDLKNALDYCRFLPETHGIVKLYVSSGEVVGCGGKLRLKPRCITNTNIHGFISAQARDFYMKNPFFEQLGLTSSA